MALLINKMSATEDSSENEIFLQLHKESDDLFLDLVNTYPALYDKSHKHYSDRVVKANAWAEISSIAQMTGKVLISLYSLKFLLF